MSLEGVCQKLYTKFLFNLISNLEGDSCDQKFLEKTSLIIRYEKVLLFYFNTTASLPNSCLYTYCLSIHFVKNIHFSSWLEKSKIIKGILEVFIVFVMQLDFYCLLKLKMWKESIGTQNIYFVNLCVCCLIDDYNIS
jgi:hypothetical protein